MEEMDVFLSFIGIADQAWKTVGSWKPFVRDTIGRQLVRAADSIGANLVEGDGRYSDADALHFFIIARASARETQYWLNRAMERGIIDEAEVKAQVDELQAATRLLNGLINFRRAVMQPRRRPENAQGLTPNT
jgi:four helix bundle protein